MTDQLHQLNVNYVPVEDRLMFRMNTKVGDEYRVWFTRRFSGLLLDLLNKEIDKHGGVPTLASTPETKKLFKQGAMEKRYEEEKTIHFPLGESGFLACKINYKTTDEGVFMLEILPESGKGINLNLNKTMLFMFYNLLTQGCTQSGWNLAGEAQIEQNIH